ncbi:MAG: fibronectin type III domain-containing protein, partial [Clostridia bacterium]|nr:fibronectin type III domain-containing protein [Clostridia bacterium]
VEVIAKTGHAWDEGEVIKAASCKEEGKMKYKCNNMCGETKEETVKKTDHNYKEVITHATCTEAGYSTFTCTVCGSHYVDKPVEAYGHMFETYFYDEGSATCYQDGTKTAECANGCGTKNTVADPGSKTDHEMTDFTVITPATCTEDGEEEAKCFYHEKCGYSEIVPVEALGHDDSGEFVETKAATCTEKGEKQKTCTRCPEIVATEEIPALGHDETAEFVETLAATCTTDGSKEKKCARCSEVIATEAIPALGHDIAAEYTIDVPATCTTEGSQSKHCSRCDYKDGVVAIPASGHDMQPGEGTTATCTEPGKAVFVCANGCGKTHEEANVPALGHSFTYTSNGDATCQADGTKTGKCIRCDVTETVADEGSMLEHVFGEPVIDKASTEKGGLVTTKCTNCEYEEVEEIAMIDSLKLKYETVVYDGKYKRPSLTITDAEGAKLIKGEDYLLELPEKDECINAGTYTYTVTFIGNYEGEATLTYKVVPGKASKIVSKGTKQTYIDLKWSTVKGADGYRIYVKTSSGGWKKLATVKGKTTYRVKDLKAGTNYTFAVKAFSKAADGETTIWATEFAEQAFKTLPGKTSKLTAKTNKNAVKLTWKEVKGAEGYRVYVKTAKGGWKTVATVKGGKVTYTVKELKANTTYEYAVKAFYKDGSATVWSNQFTTVKAKTAK